VGSGPFAADEKTRSLQWTPTRCSRHGGHKLLTLEASGLRKYENRLATVESAHGGHTGFLRSDADPGPVEGQIGRARRQGLADGWKLLDALYPLASGGQLLAVICATAGRQRDLDLTKEPRAPRPLSPGGTRPRLQAWDRAAQPTAACNAATTSALTASGPPKTSRWVPTAMVAR
jgi:hypothetical protein